MRTIHAHVYHICMYTKETKCTREKGSCRLVEPIQAFVLYASLKRRDVRAELKKKNFFYKNRVNKIHKIIILPFECCSLQKF